MISFHPLLHDLKAIIDPAEHSLSFEACSPLGSKSTPLLVSLALSIYSFSVSFADLTFLISKFWSAPEFQCIELSPSQTILISSVFSSSALV